MKHLTQDELDEMLMGDGTPAMQSHVKVCAVCASQLTQFQAAMGAFNQASLAWAESKSNTIPRGVTSPPSRYRWAFPEVGTFAALALALGVAMHQPPAMPRVQTAMAAPELTRQIADDNALMAEIDSALAAPDTPTALEATAAQPSLSDARKEKN